MFLIDFDLCTLVIHVKANKVKESLTSGNHVGDTHTGLEFFSLEVRHLISNRRTFPSGILD
jgi:hypothetical protein